MTAPTAGEFQGREHVLPVRVYYEDTDFTGVVYHANYLRFFERGRSDFLRLASTGHAELLDREDPLAFVATRMEIDFVKAARIDDALTVRTAYDRVKGPRLFISQAIERSGEVICRGRVGRDWKSVSRKGSGTSVKSHHEPCECNGSDP